MLRPEALATLRSYTSLPNRVQGVLEPSEDGYETARFVTSGEGFDRLLRRTADDTVALAAMTLLPALGPVEEGQRFLGPFLLRGAVFSARRGCSVAVGRVVRGSLPPDAPMSRGGVVLAGFMEEDRLDAEGATVHFGTETSAGPLAPDFPYVAPLLDRRLGRALVACANGVFALRALPSAFENIPEPRPLLKNLLETANLIVQLGEAGVVYRLAENCLAVAPAGSEDKLRRLQVELGLPVSSRSGVLPTAAPSSLQVSATVLDVMQGARVAEEALKELPGVELSTQPLLSSQLPPLSLAARVRLLTVAGQTAPQSFSTRFVAGAGDVGVALTLEFLDFRPLLPDETHARLRDRLVKLVEEQVRRVADSGALATKAGTDAAATTLSDGLQASVRQSGLFAEAPSADVSLLLKRAEGARVKLPSGARAVLPDYALVVGPRLAAYLGALVALGVGADFFPWATAAHGLYV